jgi:hypothetical protein
LSSNTTGNNNTASGSSSLYSNTTGSQNTASGANSLSSNTEGYQNTASGAFSLYRNTTGDHNTASGLSSLRVIFRDSCFAQDADKINIYETFKQKLDWSDQEVVKNIRVI